MAVVMVAARRTRRRDCAAPLRPPRRMCYPSRYSRSCGWGRGGSYVAVACPPCSRAHHHDHSGAARARRAKHAQDRRPAPPRSTPHALEAAGVVVRARHDGKQCLWVIASGDAGGVVHMVAEAGVKPHAIHGHAVPDRHPQPRGVDERVPLQQVVALRRLVKHGGDDAVRVSAGCRAEGVLRRRVGEAAGGEHRHGQGRVVRHAPHGVQRP